MNHPRARVFLRSVRARRFAVLPTSVRFFSGSHRFAKNPSPLRHRLVFVGRLFCGLANRLLLLASSVEQGGYLLPALCAVQDNRVICRWLFALVLCWSDSL